MAGTDGRFTLAPHGVIAEVIDGEAIIINLNQGAYFGMEGSGAAAWALLMGGGTLDEIAALMGESWAVSPKLILTDIETLSARLLEEGLMVPAPDRTVELPPLPSASAPYAPPVLNKYGDMKSMLALDPPIPEFNG